MTEMHVRAALLAGAVAAAGFACGSSDAGAEGFVPDAPGGGDGGGTARVGAEGGASGASSSGGFTGGGEASAPVCAGVASAARPFLTFEFVLDRSASMSSVWPAVVAAVNSVITDPSVPTNAENFQITHFPIDDTAAECSAFAGGGFGSGVPYPYASGPFSVDAFVSAPAGGVKDTAAALRWRMGEYANGAGCTLPDGTSVADRELIAFVLITDGSALGCSESVADVANAVAGWKYAACFPTFVATVGSPPSTLDAVAQAGGTSAPLAIDPADPQAFVQTLMKAIAPFDCTFALPSPPDGGALELTKVNVVTTPRGGSSQTLDYNPTCGGSGAGWRYNDPSHPGYIQLCRASCVAGGGTASVGITVGCPTQTVK